MLRILAVTLLLAASHAAAQVHPSLSLAADAGPAFPLGEFADDGAGIGWGLGLSATVGFTRHLGLYASYERFSFPVDETAPDPGDGTWTDSGIGVGAHLWFPVRDPSRVHPWVRLGVGWHDLDPPIAGSPFTGVNTRGVRTLEGGAGLDIALARQILFLQPVARYRRYRFEADIAGVTSTSTTSYLMLGVGLMAVIGRRVGDPSPADPAAGGLSREGAAGSVPTPR
jgi:hypothetical protein